MSNYIKINVTDPGTDLPLATATYNSASTPPITDPQFSLGTGWQGAGGTSATAVGVTGGGANASGAKAKITTTGTAGNAVVSAIEITEAGINYEVGQTITISIPTSEAINNSGSAIDTTIELTAAMLQAVSTGQKLIDVDNVIGVECPADQTQTVEVFTNLYDGSSSNLTYTCEFDLDTDTIQDVAINISEAYRKAVQAENSQPVVDLGDAVCIGVSFG